MFLTFDFFWKQYLLVEKKTNYAIVRVADRLTIFLISQLARIYTYTIWRIITHTFSWIYYYSMLVRYTIIFANSEKFAKSV